MNLHIPFDNSYARLPEGFFARQKPTPVKAPALVAWNATLAEALGISGADDPALAALFAGNALPGGAEPIAQLYAGHQFGSFNPQLGDGRAILLGEVLGQDGIRRDIQLKGSGPTPFSRMGDGRAWLGPVLREYVVSEAMHALGVPTTRALAAVRHRRDRAARGADARRRADPRRVEPYPRRHLPGLRRPARSRPAAAPLSTYTVERHYPDATDPHDLLDRVMQRQAALVAQWLSLGFIHGVMNTDNCTLSGETIDYGPCAFLDAYDPDTVFSSIDRHGRYAYAAQADIIVWNMAQLATALIALLPDPDAAITRFQAQVEAMPDLIRAEWLTRFAAKLGIARPRGEDAALIADLLDLMQAGGRTSPTPSAPSARAPTPHVTRSPTARALTPGPRDGRHASQKRKTRRRSCGARTRPSSRATTAWSR